MSGHRRRSGRSQHSRHCCNEMERQQQQWKRRLASPEKRWGKRGRGSGDAQIKTPPPRENGDRRFGADHLGRSNEKGMSPMRRQEATPELQTLSTGGGLNPTWRFQNGKLFSTAAAAGGLPVLSRLVPIAENKVVAIASPAATARSLRTEKNRTSQIAEFKAEPARSITEAEYAGARVTAILSLREEREEEQDRFVEEQIRQSGPLKILDLDAAVQQLEELESEDEPMQGELAQEEVEGRRGGGRKTEEEERRRSPPPAATRRALADPNWRTEGAAADTGGVPRLSPLSSYAAAEAGTLQLPPSFATVGGPIQVPAALEVTAVATPSEQTAPCLSVGERRETITPPGNPDERVRTEEAYRRTQAALTALRRDLVRRALALKRAELVGVPPEQEQAEQTQVSALRAVASRLASRYPALQKAHVHAILDLLVHLVSEPPRGEQPADRAYTFAISNGCSAVESERLAQHYQGRVERAADGQTDETGANEDTAPVTAAAAAAVAATLAAAAAGRTLREIAAAPAGVARPDERALW